LTQGNSTNYPPPSFLPSQLSRQQNRDSQRRLGWSKVPANCVENGLNTGLYGGIVCQKFYNLAQICSMLVRRYQIVPALSQFPAGQRNQAPDRFLLYLARIGNPFSFCNCLHNDLEAERDFAPISFIPGDSSIPFHMERAGIDKVPRRQ